MKKLMIVSAVLIALAGTVSAQNWGAGWGVSEEVTVNGTLQLQNGRIAVSDGTAVYVVPQLERYIGFLDGLKEGATVTIEGYRAGDYIRPVSVTLNGKTYDFGARTTEYYAWGRGGSRGRNAHMRGRGYGAGGCCDYF